MVGTYPFKWDCGDATLKDSLTGTMKRLGGFRSRQATDRRTDRVCRSAPHGAHAHARRRVGRSRQEAVRCGRGLPERPLEHLAPGGVLAVHITNTYLDLYPVVQRLAQQHGWKSTRIFRDADVLQYTNDYVLLSDDEAFISKFPESMGDEPEPSISPDNLPMWTDQYSNLLQILR